MRGIISLLLGLILIVSVGSARAIDTAPEAGNYAPPFELKDINGRKSALSEYRGKVVLLNFWATWCEPCKSELPSLNNIYAALKGKGFVVLGVSVDTSAKTVRNFIRDEKIVFPVLLDKDKDVYFDQYAIMGLPTSFLINHDGIIVEKIIGEKKWDSPDVRDKILRLLNREGI